MQRVAAREMQATLKSARDAADEQYGAAAAAAAAANVASTSAQGEAKSSSRPSKPMASSELKIEVA